MNSNPITEWIRFGMERYGEREASMADRVAETSINACKITDERGGTKLGKSSCYQNDIFSS